jgi:hypothetical protein
MVSGLYVSVVFADADSFPDGAVRQSPPPKQGGTGVISLRSRSQRKGQ